LVSVLSKEGCRLGDFNADRNWGFPSVNFTEQISRGRKTGIELDVLPASLDPANAIAEHPWSLLEAIVDSCQDAIISKDLTGIITSWNPAAQRMFGYTPDEAIGRSILLLIPDELHSEEAEILRSLSAGRRIERHETVRVAKDGKRLSLSLTISPIRDGEGRIIGASKIAHDIAEEKRSQEARGRLAAIVAYSEDAIISEDLGGIVTSWNDSARRMFGYTQEEMIGESIFRIVPRELHSEEREMLRRMRTGERIDHFETVRLAKDGSRIDVSLTISPVCDESGRVIGTSKIARDISARKKMENMLLQSEKIAATGRMAATIAHEINNPLEAVMNLVFLARQSSQSGSEAHRYLVTAENEVDRVSRIARTTLGYYRDRGTPTQLYLQEVIETALHIYSSKLKAQRISTECEFRQNRPVPLRKGEMMQVFSNIFANSIDAMPGGGALHIRVSDATGESGDCVQATIEDNGVGIEEQNIAHIFEPFFTTKPETGTGIGLWVTKRLIEDSGGQIAVSSSTEPGHSGTRLAIILPYAH